MHHYSTLRVGQRKRTFSWWINLKRVKSSMLYRQNQHHNFHFLFPAKEMDRLTSITVTTENGGIQRKTCEVKVNVVASLSDSGC